MVSLTFLEVDAKVGLVHFSPELWPDDRFGGAEIFFLTHTKISSNLLHHGPTQCQDCCPYMS